MEGGVKALSLAVTDGFFPLFSLRVFPQRLSHISSVISSGVLCLYELIKDGRKLREDTFNRVAYICHCQQPLCKNLMLAQPSKSFNWHAYASRENKFTVTVPCLIDSFQLINK